MKNFKSYLIALAYLLIVTACQNDSPDAVATSFLEALKKKDYEAAKNLCTDEGQGRMDFFFTMAKYKASLFLKLEAFNYSDVACVLDSTGTKAYCNYESLQDGESITESLQLIKIKDVWKVAPALDE